MFAPENAHTTLLTRGETAPCNRCEGGWKFYRCDEMDGISVDD